MEANRVPGAGGRKPVVALDGPAASGKGTIGRRVAERFGFAHLDTGLIYREVARWVADQKSPKPPRAEAARYVRGIDIVALGDRAELLREPGAEELVSVVARWPEVREAAVAHQRAFARSPPGDARGAVLDGRDIGTVVCPDADVKVFVTAKLETRALRRTRELAARGLPADYEVVKAAMRIRDVRDRERKWAPLRRPKDAVLLDTTALGIEDAVGRVADLIEKRLGSRGG